MTTPLLIDVDPNPLLVTAGDMVRLIGFNFSGELSKNRVTFTAGNQRIQGIPVRVEFPTDGNAQNGLESELLVIVPGGVSTGNVELAVSGVVAGASGYEARPQLMAFTLGRNDTQTYLVYNQILGFDAQASFVKLYGINFSEIEAVEFEDSQGGTQKILPNTIERNPVTPGATQPAVPSGYAVIGFNMRDNRNDVRLNFTPSRRDNMRVRVLGPAGVSNTLEIPIHSEPIVDRLGAVINGIKVPTGVRTGPVRITYTVYDGIVDVNYTMEVSWKIATEDDSSFRIAKPFFLDADRTEIKGVLPGMLGHASRFRLLPGGGAVRTFTWDPENDPAFIRLNETLVDGAPPPRSWAIQFKFRPIVEQSNPADVNTIRPNHQAMSPVILYYSLRDRPGDPISQERAAELRESFQTDANEDLKLNSADFGPPNNPGALVGRIPGGRITPQFGTGSTGVQLLNAGLAELQPDATGQYYYANTDDMTIVYRQITSDNGTPCDPDDDELAGGGRGQRDVPFENPGESVKEYHFATLELGEGVQLFVRGSNPLVIRLSGNPDEPDEPVFLCGPGSKIDASGCPGQAGPKPLANPDVPGDGGKPGAGGGKGGRGATLETAVNGLLTVIHAEQGALDGGGGGETTAAIDGQRDQQSRFPGGPGGGGGNRMAGRAGSPSSGVKPARYKPALAGEGGRARGEPRLLLPSPGSGGGGGGSTLSRAANSFLALINAGAGGGGGGGAVQIVANGSVVMDPASTIEANGGNGGEGTKYAFPPPPPVGIESGAMGSGGGGSGGCILVQARGVIDALCGNFSVQGGAAGVSNRDTKQNLIPGAGTGGEGWVRLESASGGVPTCAAFAASTTLTGRHAAGATKLTVQSTQGFPSPGIVALLDPATGLQLDEIAYLSTTATTFEGIAKTVRDYPDASRVFYKGAIQPYKDGVFSESKVVASPDPVSPGRGRDGEIHIRYEPSVDPVTGEPVVDSETGEVLSVWVFDTDLSVIKRPSGEVLLETSDADENPGFLDCTRFVIDPNTVLRGVGTRPMRISVSGQAEIGGIIDVSGFPGGILRITTDTRRDPLSGLGGAPGAGGGGGGDGGMVQFLDASLSNKDPANTLPVHGEPGGAPAGVPAGLDKTPVPYGNGDPQDVLLVGPSFTRATGGVTLRGRNCENPPAFCSETGGGGAGGGNLEGGKDGGAIPLPEGIAGKGGSPFGVKAFRWDGEPWVYGGTGGSGGGGNPHVSADYAAGILGSYHFRSGAVHAPGTGGGGGGGVLYLVAQNLSFRGSARILARGGDAHQSIDLGGNGGGGAGGTVFIRVRNSLSVETGATIDVRGGVANLTPPVLPGQDFPEYPGNIRVIGNQPRTLGGAGGNGSAGRIRIEAESGSRAALSGINLSVSSGPFLVDSVRSVGVSRAFRLGLGPGLVAGSHEMAVGTPVARYFEFGQPPGTDSAVLWQGAAESLDQHGAPGAFSSAQGLTGLAATRTPGELPGREFVRFVVPFLSNAATNEAQSIRELRLPYWLPEAGSP
ncbi:MAG: hypothetical protein HY721_30690 [Planctomycetes bacterium]|nr:hypothetical protein [Planctomycetota bacterium]